MVDVHPGNNKKAVHWAYLSAECFTEHSVTLSPKGVMLGYGVVAPCKISGFVEQLYEPIIFGIMYSAPYVTKEKVICLQRWHESSS